MAVAEQTSNALREAVAQVTSVLRAMWTYRWLALTVSWVVAIVAVTFALRVPSQYEALDELPHTATGRVAKHRLPT